MFLIFIATLGTVISLFVALITLLKNPKSSLHRWLFLFLVFTNAWGVFGNLQGLLSPDNAAWIARSAFLSAVALSYCMLRFAVTVSRTAYHARLKLFEFCLLLTGLFISASDYVISGFTTDASTGFLIPTRGLLYPLVIIFIVYFILRACVLIEIKRRSSKGSRRLQLGIIFTGLSLGALTGITSNVILPNITHNTYISRYAFIGIAIWTLFLVYAVVQHRFLDIRLAIVRTLGYVMALVVVALLYVVIVFSVSQTIFIGSTAQLPLQGYDILIAVAVGLTFHPLYRFFNKITTKFFYRDAYDTQEVIDDITTVLARTIDLPNVLSKPTEILYSALRTDYIAVVLLKSNTAMVDNFFVGRDVDYLALAKRLAKEKLKTSIVVAEEIEDAQPAFYKKMHDHDTAILVKLEISSEIEGYILYGYKSNGSIFTAQDLALIRISAESLSIAIQNALRFEEIRDFNKTLQAKVDEATSKLRRSNAKLKQLDEAKDEFISMASHQLRTPLTSVKGYLSMVLEGDAGDLQPGQKKLLEEAYSAAQRMVYLIADFLNVSRLKTGKFVLEYSSVNLAHLIGEEIGQLKATAGSRQMTLQYEAPEVLPTARLDENKIRQVVMNLIDNAIYYSKPGGIIKVELFADDGHVVFRVKDNGIGVPQNEQKDLFEKFFRASNARKVRPDGTGIGLFMIKKVILAHGGSIIFHSTVGQGSTFGFSLPLKAHPKSTRIEGESLQQSSK